MKTWFSTLWCSILFMFVTVTVAPCAHAIEKPIRALHFVIYKISVSEAKHLIDLAHASKYNTIILGLPWRDGIKLNSTPWVKKKHSTWTRSDLIEVVNYARKRNLSVVPQLPLLSQRNVLFGDSHKELNYNSSTYDPRNPNVYDIVFPLLDELVEIIQPSAIHIGHDEVFGWTQRHFDLGRLMKGEKILPPDLFLLDVHRLHSYLRNYNITTWMWGDMLIEPDEFPAMKGGADINGSSLGYGKVLRDKLPRDIVICDWHYRDGLIDYPTLSTFRNDGFHVLGATWRNLEATLKFSNYASSHGSKGMIATTWMILGASGNGVVNSLPQVERLIIKSGEIFEKYFPNEKS